MKEGTQPYTMNTEKSNTKLQLQLSLQPLQQDHKNNIETQK